MDCAGRRGIGTGSGANAGACCDCSGYRNGGHEGDLGCDPRGGGGVSKEAVQDDRGDCSRAGCGAFPWVSLVSQDGAICAEDGGEFSDGCGVFGAGRVHGDVLLDTREHTDGFWLRARA